MSDGGKALPPLEVLQRLAGDCDTVESEVRGGRSVDIEAMVGAYPEAFRDFVRPELQGVLDELLSPEEAFDPDDQEQAIPADRRGRYELLGQLGQGGMGRVRVAWDRQLSRRVALKELNPRKAHDPHYRRRFEQEAEITARLDHPGILPIYGRGEQSDETPYYTMRLVAGGEAKTLQAAIDELHALPQGSADFTAARRQLLRRLIDVSNTIAYAHSRGICHRDLKPANILIGPFGETLVVDWGLAKDFGAASGSDPTGDAKSDSPAVGYSQSSGAGTPGFVAPESRDGNGVHDWPRIDVYSLGAILHCVLTGAVPHSEPSTEEGASHQASASATTSRISSSTISGSDRGARVPLRLPLGVPKPLKAICDVALDPDPSKRYPGPLEFASDLERYLSGQPVSVSRETFAEAWVRWGNANRSFVFASALFGMIVTAAAGAIAVQQWQHNLELRQKSERLAQSLQSEAMLREQEQAARKIAEQQTELANQQTEVARRREDLAVDAMRSYAEAISGNETLKGSASLTTLRQELLAKPIRFFEQLQQVEAPGSRPSSDYLRRLAQTSEDLSRLSYEYGDTTQCGRWVDQAIERYTQWLAIAKEERNGNNTNRGTGEGKDDAASKGSDTVDPVEEAKLAIAGCYRLKGMMQMLGGDPLAAEGSFQRASEGYASLAEDDRIRERKLNGVALLRTVEAIRAADTRNGALATERFQEAIPLREELLRIAQNRSPNVEGESPVSVSQRQTELDMVLQDQAHVSLLLRIGDPKPFFDQYARQIGMLEEMLRRGEGSEHIRLRLAWALHNLGGHQINHGDQQAAVETLGRALPIREALVKDYPSVSRYRMELASTATELGIALGEAGRSDEAIARLEEGIRGYRQMVAQMPQSPVFAMELATRVHTLGHHYFNTFNFEKGEEAFAESLGMVQNIIASNPGNPAMIALHRELLWHQAQSLLARGAWADAETTLSGLWEMLQNGPVVSINAFMNIDKGQLLDDWVLAAQRSGNGDAVTRAGGLRDEVMREEGMASADVRTIDEQLASGLNADAIAGAESERLVAIAQRAYRKGDYGLVQRIGAELIERWDAGGEPSPPSGAKRWEVIVRYAEAAIRDADRYGASGDADEAMARRGLALEAMKRLAESLPASDEKVSSPENLSSEKSSTVQSSSVQSSTGQLSRNETMKLWERTMRNAVFVPVRDASAMGRLPEGERREWQEAWGLIDAMINRERVRRGAPGG